MSDELKHTLEVGNKVFTTFFTTEAVLKLLGMSKEYFQSGWNVFDLVIVLASLVDLFAENLNGVSVLRGMRLVRYFFHYILFLSLMKALVHVDIDQGIIHFGKIIFMSRQHRKLSGVVLIFFDFSEISKSFSSWSY